MAFDVVVICRRNVSVKRFNISNYWLDMLLPCFAGTSQILQVLVVKIMLRRNYTVLDYLNV